MNQTKTNVAVGLFILLTLVLGACLAVYALQNREAKLDPLEDESPSSWDSDENWEAYRLSDELRRRFVRETCSFADSIDDAEAKEICADLRDNTVTAIVRNGRLVLPRSADRKPNMIYTIIASQDGERFQFNGLDSANCGKALACVVLVRPHPILIIQKPGLSKLVMSLVVLHEGLHIRFLKARSSDAGFTKTEKAVEEVHTRELEFRLMEKLGGERYTALVNEQTDRFVETDLQMSDEELAAVTIQQRDALSEIFKDQGEFDLDQLHQSLLLDAAFRNIDGFLPDKNLNIEAKARGYIETKK